MKARLFIFLLFLTWPPNIKCAHSPTTFAKLCLAKHGDFVAHPQDCSKFIRCSHNRAYEFQCADKLLWHHEIKSCDFPQHVKCAASTKIPVKRETTKPTKPLNKFKREIKKNSDRQDNKDNVAATTKMEKTLSSGFNKLTALPTSMRATGMSNKSFKLTRNDATTLPCNKANISSNEAPTATGNLVNLTTNNVKLTNNQVKFATDIEFATQKVETTNLSVNLTNNLVNSAAETVKSESTSSIELPTDAAMLTRDLTTGSSSIEIPADEVNLAKTTNLSVNLTNNLVNSTAEKFVNLTTVNSESTSSLKLPTEQAMLARDLTTDTSKLPADETKLAETTNLSVNLTKNLVNLTAEIIVNITTEKMESISSIEFPTDQKKLVATLNSSQPMSTATTAKELTTAQVELKGSTISSGNLTNNLVNSTAETVKSESTNSIELPTDQAMLTGDMTTATSSIEIPADEVQLAETTNLSVNLTNNLVNSTEEKFVNLTTRKMESISSTEFPTDQVKLVATKNSSQHLPTGPSAGELKTAQGELKVSTNLCDNLTNNLVNSTAETVNSESTSSIQLPTDQAMLTRDLITGTSADEVKMAEMTNLSVNLTNNLIKSTAEKFVNSTMVNSEPTSSVELTADQVKLAETANLSVNLTNLITETFVNLTTSSIELSIDKTKDSEFESAFGDVTAETSSIEFTTADYRELSETTDISVNLTKNFVSPLADTFANLTTEKFIATNQTKFTELPNSVPAKPTDTSAMELTTLSLNSTKNFVKPTAETFTYLTTEKLDSANSLELSTDQAILTEADTNEKESTTADYRESMTTTNLSVNLTEMLVNSTAETYIILTTNILETISPAQKEIIFLSESENLTTKNQMESLSTLELTPEPTYSSHETTENLANLSTENLVNLPIRPDMKDQGKPTTTINSSAVGLGWHVTELNTENSLNIKTTIHNSTADPLQYTSTSTFELPTDHGELLETAISLTHLKENIGNLPTSKPAIKNKPLKSTSFTELPTELTTDQHDFVETPKALKENIGNFLPTSEAALKFETFESTNYMELPTELPTDQADFVVTPNALINLKENIENLPTSEPTIKTEPLDSTRFTELPTELPTDQDEFVETPTTLINLQENIENLPTSEAEIKLEHFESTSFTKLPTKLPTDQAEYIETPIAWINLKENIGNLPTSEPTIKIELSDSTRFNELPTELPTDQADFVETPITLINLKENIGNLATSEAGILEHFESTSFTKLPTELPTDQADFVETPIAWINLKENIENFLQTSEPNPIKIKPFESTSFTELPTDQADFVETPNALINLKENIGNFLPTSEPTIATESSELTRFTELPTELPTDQAEFVETPNTLKNLKENIGNLAISEAGIKLEPFESTSYMELPTELPNDQHDFVEKSNVLINSKENIVYFLATSKPNPIKIKPFESTSFTELPINQPYLKEATGNSNNFSLEKIHDSATTQQELIRDRLESASTREEPISAILDHSNTVALPTHPEELTETNYFRDKTTNGIINSEFKVTTNQLNKEPPTDELIEISTFIPQTTDKTITTETTLETMKSTSTILSLDASTTLDPRLPFRSPACRGANNRRQFMASRCYQYYQCFAGWAFLLNCHDGWWFQTDIGACTRDVYNECKL